MQMPGRKYQAGSTSNYRYSINGQEKESELNENITTALYWEYDSRIVRRWNTDPIPNSSNSPYLCFEANPVFLSDIKGDKVSDWVRTQDGKTINDSRVTNDETAAKYYEGGKYLAPGSSFTTSSGENIVLGKSGNFSNNGVNFHSPDQALNSKQYTFIGGDITQFWNGVVRSKYALDAFRLKPLYLAGHSTGNYSLLELGANKRTELIIEARKVTPEPWLSFAKDMKSDVAPRPNARFYLTNKGVNIKAIGFGAGNGLLLGYGLYNSYQTISQSQDKAVAVHKEVFVWSAAWAGGKIGASALAEFGPVPAAIGGVGGSIIGGFLGEKVMSGAAGPCNSCLPVYKDNTQVIKIVPLYNPNN